MTCKRNVKNNSLEHMSRNPCLKVGSNLRLSNATRQQVAQKNGFTKSVPTTASCVDTHQEVVNPRAFQHVHVCDLKRVEWDGAKTGVV